MASAKLICSNINTGVDSFSERNKMKLLQELLSLREEAIEVVKAADLWKDNKDNVQTFVPNAVYSVKKVEDATPTEYEIYSDTSGKRKLVATMNAEELEDNYVPVRANQKEDAEGFTFYRDAEEVEAFKYEEDTVKIDLEGSTETLKKGDYLIRSAQDDEFIYSVQASKYFEDDYTEKK